MRSGERCFDSKHIVQIDHRNAVSQGVGDRIGSAAVRGAQIGDAKVGSVHQGAIACVHDAVVVGGGNVAVGVCMR